MQMVSESAASYADVAPRSFELSPDVLIAGFGTLAAQAAKAATTNFCVEQRPILGSEKNHYRYLSECHYSPKCPHGRAMGPGRPGRCSWCDFHGHRINDHLP